MMTNPLGSNRIGMRMAAAALAIITLASCTKSAVPEAKVAAADSTQRMPMDMPMTDKAGTMGTMGTMGGCPLSLTSLALTPSQKATFDSVRTEHRAAMQREMSAALARARAVLTGAQQVQFDSASAAHTAMMAKMMNGGSCMN